MSIIDNDEPEVVGVIAAQYATIPEEVLFCPNLDDRALRIYALLQFRMGRNDSAWPSHKKLANDCSCSVSSVKRSLQLLQDLGLMQVKERRRADGSRSSNLYVLWPKTLQGTTNAGPRLNSVRGDGSELPYSQQVTREPVPQVTSEPVSAQGRPSKEPTKKNHLKKEPASSPPAPTLLQFPSSDESAREQFEEIWKVYPRKIDKKAALSKFIARIHSGVPIETLATAAARYAEVVRRDGKDLQYVMHGATFFGPSEKYKRYVDDGEQAQHTDEEKFFDEEGDEIDETAAAAQDQGSFLKTPEARQWSVG